jgi:phosphoglycolate phosphatase
MNTSRADIGLFFDLDNTLAKSEPVHHSTFREAFRPYGLDITWESWCAEAVGHSDQEILALYLQKIPHSRLPANPNSVLAEKRKRFLDLVQNTSLVPKQSVDAICGLVHPLAIVTSSPLDATQAVLQGAGIAEYFSCLVCLDDVKKPKPHPEAYLLAKARLGVSCGIAFEDSSSGIASATAAGLTAVKVSRPEDLPMLIRSSLATMPPYVKEREL